ncbi:peptidoglycan-binding protein [Actinokineospora auranticolor]|uniref:Multidrug efflux pump subunit AcrA (Membrane-fusion protein) n=1 Tax=Actinokineospora auranticolor TaxID=155976 RepID=A0A2S6H1I5_9PSEU|nr:peptidoglycan-binding protein [Actinokineospora auranticolor]PPK71345.1 multidrug efflux pump subunit AcrA (membrane-fusion protein) [Actinokineospora auranticolor]
MSGSSKRGRVAVGLTVVLAVSGAAAAAAGVGFDNGSTRDEPRRERSPQGTVKVTRETLIDTHKEDGRLGFGATTAVQARLPGTLTAAPAVGSTVQRGQALCRIDNAPVVLLYGSLPAYRALDTGAEGADVRQFEENLAALGYKGFTVDEKYTRSTAKAVEDWQEDLGLPETGAVELGRVVYAAGSIRVDSHKTTVGQGVQPGGSVVEYTGSARLVTVELTMDDQRMAPVGAEVTVRLPDGKTVPGKVTAAETVVDEGNGAPDAEPETKLKVTVAPADEGSLVGLDQASVGVEFTSSRRADVLTVPVSALLALAEGGYGVQVVDAGTTRTVAVRTGMFANGRVEVTGVSEGQSVGVPG